MVCRAVVFKAKRWLTMSYARKSADDVENVRRVYGGYMNKRPGGRLFIKLLAERVSAI